MPSTKYDTSENSHSLKSTTIVDDNNMIFNNNTIDSLNLATVADSNNVFNNNVIDCLNFATIVGNIFYNTIDSITLAILVDYDNTMNNNTTDSLHSATVVDSMFDNTNTSSDVVYSSTPMSTARFITTKDSDGVDLATIVDNEASLNLSFANSSVSLFFMSYIIILVRFNMW